MQSAQLVEETWTELESSISKQLHVILTEKAQVSFSSKHNQPSISVIMLDHVFVVITDQLERLQGVVYFRPGDF